MSLIQQMENLEVGNSFHVGEKEYILRSIWVAPDEDFKLSIGMIANPVVLDEPVPFRVMYFTLHDREAQAKWEAEHWVEGVGWV